MRPRFPQKMLLIRGPCNVLRSDPRWAPQHARPLRSQGRRAALAAALAVMGHTEAQGPVEDLWKDRYSLRLMEEIRLNTMGCFSKPCKWWDKQLGMYKVYVQTYY